MIKIIKKHPVVTLIYFASIFRMVFPFRNTNIAILFFAYLNILCFILVNYLTVCYNREKKVEVRSITIQIKLALIAIIVLMIFNYLFLYFGGPAFGLSSKNITVVFIQNTILFVLVNPFNLFVVAVSSFLCDGSLWT